MFKVLPAEKAWSKPEKTPGKPFINDPTVLIQEMDMIFIGRGVFRRSSFCQLPESSAKHL